MPDLKEELLKGYKIGNGTTYKVHLDGYNNLDLLDRQVGEVGAPRILLLRRDRPDGGARRRLEDAHRRQAQDGQLVQREVLPERALHHSTC